jgi:predicted transcriptional regulator
MELNEIPEAFQTKLRIAVLSSLISGKKTFKEIKQISGATDGNISIQISKLEELGYVLSTKEFIKKKPLLLFI